MYIDIDEVRWDMPPDHNLNSSGEYRSMRWFTPIFPQRIMRHFKFFYSKSTPPDVWPVKILQHPKGKATNARHQDVPIIFSWWRFTHLWTHWKKKMTPPTCWWSTHVNLPYYQCILWLVALMIHLYSFQAAKIKWTPHCNPIFFCLTPVVSPYVLAWTSNGAVPK